MSETKRDASKLGRERPRPAGRDSKTQRKTQLRRVFLAVIALALIGLAWPAWQWGRTQNSLSAVRAALQQREFERAIADLQTLERHHPNNGEVQFLLAVAHRRSDRPLDALRFLQRAEELNHAPADIERERKMAKFELGDIAGSERYLRQLVVAGDSTDDVAEELLESLAKGYLADHRLSDARFCLDRWIEWQADSIPPRLLRATLYGKSELWAEAIGDYRRILELAPDHVEARLKLAQALLNVNEVDEAQTQYEQCRAADRENAVALLGLARCQARLGNPEAAEALLSQIPTDGMKPPLHAQVLAERGELALRARDYPRASRLFQQSLEKVPLQSIVHYSLAKTLESLGEKEEAREHFELSQSIRQRQVQVEKLTQQVAKETERADLRFEIGTLLRIDGNAEEAAYWFTTTLRIDPRHAGAHRALAELFAARGDADMALRHRQAAEAVATNKAAPPEKQ